MHDNELVMAPIPSASRRAGAAMEFRALVEPQQGASDADQLAVAQTAERLGFSGFFRSDHFLAHHIAATGGDVLPGSTRLVGDPRRNRPRNLDHPAGHAGDLAHIPLPGRCHRLRLTAAQHLRREVVACERQPIAQFRPRRVAAHWRGR